MIGVTPECVTNCPPTHPNQIIHLDIYKCISDIQGCNFINENNVCVQSCSGGFIPNPTPKAPLCVS